MSLRMRTTLVLVKLPVIACVLVMLIHLLTKEPDYENVPAFEHGKLKSISIMSSNFKYFRHFCMRTLFIN